MRNCRRPFPCAVRYTHTHKHTLPQSAYTATLPYLNSGSIAPTRTTGPMNVNADVAGWGALSLSLAQGQASRHAAYKFCWGLRDNHNAFTPDGVMVGAGDSG